MAFLVLPALIPDIRVVYDTYFAAFAADADGRVLLDIIFPGGFTSPQFREAHTKGTLVWWHTSATQYTFKCVDAATGEVVGMALCDIFVQERGPEDQSRKLPEVGWLEGKQKQRAEKVLKELWQAREKVCGGRKYIYIHAFAVDPKHQGRGAGAALVQTLIDLGNSNRLPIYLESSPGSQGLYRKMGFWNVPCEIARAVHHVDVLGVEKAVEVPLMVKLPDSMTLSSELKEGKQLDDVYMDWCRQDAEDDNSI